MTSKQMKTWDAIYQFWQTEDGQLYSQHMGLLIRCKDCKFHSKNMCWFDDDCYVWLDKDFCSRAERKDDNE